MHVTWLVVQLYIRKLQRIRWEANCFSTFLLTGIILGLENVARISFEIGLLFPHAYTLQSRRVNLTDSMIKQRRRSAFPAIQGGASFNDVQRTTGVLSTCYRRNVSPLLVTMIDTAKELRVASNIFRDIPRLHYAVVDLLAGGGPMIKLNEGSSWEYAHVR